MCANTGKNKDTLITKEEKFKTYKKLLEYEKKQKITKVRHPNVSIFRGKTSVNYIGNRGGCTAGIAACSITAKGDVLPCPFLRVQAGNIFENSLEYIWNNSELLKNIRNRSNYEKCGECKYVSFCGGCRKSAYESSGNIIGYDDECLLEVLDI